jgi:DNA-binding response OmpR family regulator
MLPVGSWDVILLVWEFRLFFSRLGNRRSIESLPSANERSGFTFDSDTYCASIGGKDLNLTRNEYRLLDVLASNPGRVFNRDELLDLAWEDSGASQDRTVDSVPTL